MNRAAIFIAAAVWCAVPAAAQNKLPPGAVTDKKVQAGYGLDKDQPFAGADPDGTGLPFKEPPPEAVAAAKKAPTRSCRTGIRTSPASGPRPAGVTPSRRES